MVDAYGLSCAAGRLAKDYKVLPHKMRCLAAAKACYKLHKAAVRPRLDLPELLLQLARRPDAMDVDGGLPELSDAQMRKVSVFLKTTRFRRREILFTQAARDKFIPDFDEHKREAKAAGLFKSEKGRDTVRRHVRKGKKKDMLYRFFLPDDD